MKFAAVLEVMSVPVPERSGRESVLGQTIFVATMVAGKGPGFTASMQIETLELSFARFESVSAEDSVTVEVFVMVCPTVPVFTVAVMTSVAVELAETVPTFQLPVELE